MRGGLAPGALGSWREASRGLTAPLSVFVLCGLGHTPWSIMWGAAPQPLMGLAALWFWAALAPRSVGLWWALCFGVLEEMWNGAWSGVWLALWVVAASLARALAPILQDKGFGFIWLCFIGVVGCMELIAWMLGGGDWWAYGVRGAMTAGIYPLLHHGLRLLGGVKAG